MFTLEPTYVNSLGGASLLVSSPQLSLNSSDSVYCLFNSATSVPAYDSTSSYVVCVTPFLPEGRVSVELIINENTVQGGATFISGVPDAVFIHWALLAITTMHAWCLHVQLHRA